MGLYAEKTKVSSEKSRHEIERTLVRYGASGFLYGWSDETAVVGFNMNDRQIKFILPMPNKNDNEFTHHTKGKRTQAAAENAFEQAVRQRWRALHIVIKAKLESIESGITGFDDEFMAHIVLPHGQTIGQVMRPQIAETYKTGKMPPLLPAPTKG